MLLQFIDAVEVRSLRRIKSREHTIQLAGGCMLYVPRQDHLLVE